MFNAERADAPSVEDIADARLGVFVETHYARLLRLARLICRDATDAADAVQIGLEQAWRKRTSLRDDDRMRSLGRWDSSRAKRCAWRAAAAGGSTGSFRRVTWSGSRRRLMPPTSLSAWP